MSLIKESRHYFIQLVTITSCHCFIQWVTIKSRHCLIQLVTIISRHWFIQLVTTKSHHWFIQITDFCYYFYYLTHLSNFKETYKSTMLKWLKTSYIHLRTKLRQQPPKQISKNSKYSISNYLTHFVNCTQIIVVTKECELFY